MNPQPSSAGRTRVAIAAAFVLGFSSCQSSARLRAEATAAYRDGEVERAAGLLEQAIRVEDSSIPGCEGNLPPLQWKFTASDAPLIALERAMVYLRQGDAASSATLLRACRDELQLRRLNTFLKYVGIDGFSTVGAILLGDWALPYCVPSYEELTVNALLTLVARLDADVDGGDPLVFANNFHSTQDALLQSSFGVEYDDIVRRPQDVLPFGHYIEGVLREEKEASMDAAIPPYRVASQGLRESSIVASAFSRAQKMQREAQGQAVHVFYFLGRGPQVESSRWQLQKSDPYIEAAVRIAMAAIEVVKVTLIDAKGYNFTEALVQNLTQAPIPVPFLAKIDPRVRPTTMARIRQGKEGAEQVAESPIESIANFHKIVEANLDSLRVMRLSRALLRRSLKEASLQAIGNSLIRNATRFFSTIVEEADTRYWATLPAEIRVARLVVPPGIYELDLGLVGAGKVKVRTESGRDAYIMVIDSGEAVPRPTILIDRYSRIEPTEGPDLTP